MKSFFLQIIMTFVSKLIESQTRWRIVYSAVLCVLTVPTFAATPLTGVTQIWSQGKGSLSYHSCALISGGGIKCWGGNGSGQLGDGTTSPRYTPVDVSGLTSGMTAIALGFYYSCALTSGGGIKCWGDNGNGQLGDGTVNPAYTPVDVSGLTSGVTAIALGNTHSCALTSGGGVKCWGNNGNGRLGDGTTTPSYIPINVSGLTSGVIAIALGNGHSCALTSGGGVKCWGWNIYGQLGDGTTTPRYTPIDVSGLTSGVTAIALGYFHSCALTSGGGIKCWGDNIYGQLGDGTTTPSYTPVDVSGLTSGVTAIALGGYHSCALTSGGGVKCWGTNNHSQLGDGTGAPGYTPVDVSNLTSGVTAIALGLNHSCALTNSGGIKCWGWNTNGHLGDGTIDERSIPVDVVMSAPEINVYGNTVNIVDGDTTPSVTDNTDFGSVPVGSSLNKTFLITNDGELLTLTLPVTLSGPGCTPFSVTTQPTSPVAVSGGTTSFAITYTPTSVTTDTCTVSIASDDPDESLYDFVIQGSSYLPLIPGYVSSVSPTSTLNIGTSIVGTPVTADLTISENGNTSLNVYFEGFSGTHAADFKITTPSLSPLTIADGAGPVAITITCIPSATGLRTASLELTSDDPNNLTITYPLECQGELPVYQSTPIPNTTLNIGETLVKSAVSKTFTVTEQGVGDLKVSNPVITGDHASDFSVISPLFPFTITDDSNITKTIGIRCVPSELGLRTAILELQSNDPNNPKPTYPLECTGIALTAGYAATLSTTEMLDFGSQPIGTVVTRSFDISETGKANLTVELVNLDDPNFQILSPQFPITVADGSNLVTVTIQCQPTTVGIHYSELKLSTNDPLSPTITYILTCIGEDVTAAFDSVPKPDSTLTFSNLTDYNAYLTIVEVGNSSLEIKTATLLGDFAKKFIINDNPLPLILENNALSQTLTIHCAINDTDKIVTATLQLTTNDPDHPLVSYPLVCANLHGYHPPTDILLSNSVITPEMSKESTIGLLNTVDPEIENFPTTPQESLCATCHAPKNISMTKPTYTYTLLENTAGLFKITGNQLQLAEILPLPITTFDYPIVIRSTDPNGFFLDKSFTIHVLAEEVVEPKQATYTSVPAPNGILRFTTTADIALQSDVTITNEGQQELQVDFSGFEGSDADNFTLITPLPLQVAGQSSQILTIRCIPPENGLYVAKLVLSTNDGFMPSPTYVLLCGPEKSGPGYSSFPLPDSTLDVGSSPLGQAVTTELNVLEIGDETLEITDAAIVGTNAADFTLSEQRFSLANGSDPYLLKIQCIPKNVCQQTAHLILATNDPLRPAVNYELSCQGLPTATTMISSNIYLSNQVIDKNSLGDRFVGQITTDDIDPQGRHQYELVCDPHQKFIVIGDGLYIAPNATFDFSTQSSYSIVIRGINSTGISFSQGFTVSTNEVSETKIFSGLILTELGDKGHNVTIDSPEKITLKVLIDPPLEHLGKVAEVNIIVRYLPLDSGKPITVKRPPRRFELSEQLEFLVFKGSLAGYSGTFHADANYELSNGVKVAATNIATLQVRRNRPPTTMTLAGNRLAKAAPAGTVIGTLNTIDPDKNEWVTYFVVDNPEQYFVVFGNQLVRANTPYSLRLYQTVQIPITIRAVDSADSFVDQEFTIFIEE